MRMLATCILLVSFAPIAFAANSTTVTITRLVIDANTSSFEWQPGFQNPGPSNSGNFGGLVDVKVTEHYIDTLGNGLPRTPVIYRNLHLDFPVLNVPVTATDFTPDTDLGTFDLIGTEISGDLWNLCTVEWAIGNMCSVTTIGNIVNSSLVGSFNATSLVSDGSTRHGLGASYYTFHVEAQSVPLPPAVIMLAASCLPLLRRRATRCSASVTSGT